MEMVQVTNNPDGTTLITINRPARKNAICAITARELQSALLSREALAAMLAADLMRTDVPVTHEDETMDTAFQKLSVREVDAIAVVEPGSRRLLGVLTRERLMQAYGEALSEDA